MHLSLRILVAVSLCIRPARRPPSSQQHDSPFRNSSMPLLPFFHARRRKLKIRVPRPFCAHIQHHFRTHQSPCGNLVHRCLPWRKMGRRVEVRSVVLKHPETPRKVTVLLDRRIHLRFEEFLIPGPGHQLVANRVTQIDHPRLPRWNPFEHGILARTLRKKNHERSGTSRQNTGTANGRHLITPVYPYGSGMPGVATIPAMRRISWYSVSLIVETISRTFFTSFILFSAGLARSSASVTCRGSFSNARKSATRFFSLRSCGSG